MNDKLDDLMYQAGLTAQGCWDHMDDYDRAAILKFAELIVRECANLFPLTFTDEQYQRRIDKTILKHFGVDR
jgi:hypothetical protein